MKETGSPKLLFENLDLTPIQQVLWRDLAKIGMHVAICYPCILAVAKVAHKIGRPELANSIAFTY